MYRVVLTFTHFRFIASRWHNPFDVLHLADTSEGAWHALFLG